MAEFKKDAKGRIKGTGYFMIKNHNKVVLLYSLQRMHKGSLDEKK